MRKILIIDTSILCVWLQVPGKDTCGLINYADVNEHIEAAIREGATLALPLATIIETGNHISQASGDKFAIAKDFCELIIATIEETSPWAAFSHQSGFWHGDSLKKLLIKWQERVNTNHSLGDASIVDVAQFYAELPNTIVEIYTGDEGLKAYQPIRPSVIPRRRK